MPETDGKLLKDGPVRAQSGDAELGNPSIGKRSRDHETPSFAGRRRKGRGQCDLGCEGRQRHERQRWGSAYLAAG